MKKEWEMKKLGEVCSIGDGNYSSKYPKASEFISKGIPFLTATNLKNGVIIPDGIRYISKEQHNTLTKGHVRRGDLVIVVRGSSTGNNSIVSEEYEGSNLNSQLAYLRVDGGKIESRYLFCVFNSPDVQRVILDTISGAAQPQLPNNKLLNIEIPIPPLSEQKRIVEILDKTFVAIDKAKVSVEKNLENAKELFESYLQNVFANKGDDWEEKKLGEVCKFQNGQAHEKQIDEKGKFILVNSRFVSSNGEDFKRTSSALSPLFKGDVVLVMSDVPNGKTLAKCFLIDKDNTYSLNQRICVIRTERFDKRFLYYQLNRHKYLLSFNNGENQTNLRKDDILNCPFINSFN